MSELAEAWKAVHERHEAIGDSLDMRPLFMGLDVDVLEVNGAAIAFAEESTGEALPDSHTLDVAAAWADGFMVGAMLFLRRMEQLPRTLRIDELTIDEIREAVDFARLRGWRG